MRVPRLIFVVFSFVFLSGFLYSQPPCQGPEAVSDPCDPSINILGCDSTFNNFCVEMDQEGATQAFPGCSANWALHNDHWFSFIAGSDSISIDIIPSNCMGGEGLQAALYGGTCSNLDPIDAQCSCVSESTINLSGITLQPGQQYFIVVDGCNGTACKVEFQLVQGSLDAVDLPPIEQEIELSNGSTTQGDTICMGEDGVTASVEYDYGLNTQFIWTLPNGDTLRSSRSPLNLPLQLFDTSGLFELCVAATTNCETTPLVCDQFYIDGVDIMSRSDTICMGDTVSLGGEDFTSTGTYLVDPTPQISCDRLIELQLDVIDTPRLESVDIDHDDGTGSGSIDPTFPNSANHSYFWSIGSTEEDISGLFPGTYSLTVTNELAECKNVFFFEVRFDQEEDCIELNGVSDPCNSEIQTMECSAPGSEYCFTMEAGDDQQPFPGCSGLSVLQNDSWFSFVANSQSIAIEISPEDCTVSSGSGSLQAGIYGGSCDNLNPVDLQCFCGYHSGFRMESSQFVPGERYFIVLDGCRGSVCEGTIEIIEGSFQGNSPRPIESEIELTGDQIKSEDTICMGASFLSSSLDSLPGNSTKLLWTLPDGRVLEGRPGATSIELPGVAFREVGLNEICVRATNGCNNTPEVCRSVFVEGAEHITNRSEIICEGESISLKGKIFSETGIYYIPRDSNKFCDSLIELYLDVVDTPKLIDVNIGQKLGQNSGFIDPEFQGSGTLSYEWSTGSTEDAIRNLKPGMYSLTVTNDNGCRDVFSFEIEEKVPEQEEGPQIYTPFHSGTDIEIRTQEQQTIDLQVFDISGRLIHEESRLTVDRRQRLSFDEALNHSGLYFYRLITEDGTVHTGKWVEVKE